MSPATAEPDIKALFATLVDKGEMYDLSHALTPGMPVFTYHAPYTLTLHRRHGDPHANERPGHSSFANEVIVMPGHAATHIDALGHFSRNGEVHGGCAAHSIETHQGLSRLDAAEIAPIWRRGVLLDAAAHRGVPVLEPGAALRGRELQAIAQAQDVQIRGGDVVLVRTGWSTHWDDPPTFNGGKGGFPGPDSDGAAWLIERGAALVGSDTPVFEAIPFPGDSVHAMLLVDRGIHIIENLNLERLGADCAHTFLFIALPLRIVGATGAPFRPIAVV